MNCKFYYVKNVKDWLINGKCYFYGKNSLSEKSLLIKINKKWIIRC